MAQTLAEILVEHRIISPTTLERALVRRQTEGKQLEEVLLGMGVLSRQELEIALRMREASLSLKQDKKCSAICWLKQI